MSTSSRTRPDCLWFLPFGLLLLHACSGGSRDQALGAQSPANLIANGKLSFSDCSATTQSDPNQTFELHGAASFVPGRDDCGIALDGNDGAVELGGKIHDGSGVFSVALWFALDDTTHPQTLVSQDGSVQSAFEINYTGAGAQEHLGSIDWVIRTSDATDATVVHLTSSTSVLPYSWNHLAATLDPLAKQATLFLNGRQVASASVSMPFSSQRPAFLGRAIHAGAPAQYFHGRMDNITWVNRLLSASEVAKLAATGEVHTPIRAPAIPLAVRDPYNSLWMASDTPQSHYTTFWNGGTQALVIQARVDGIGYSVMSPGSPTPAQAGKLVLNEITPTQTRQIYQLGSVALQLTFVSGLEPNNLSRMSNPLTTILMRSTSLDGSPHNVDLYADISAEFAHGDSSTQVAWQRVGLPIGSCSNLTGFAITPSSPTALAETSDRASWGTQVWASGGDHMSYQSGADATVRGQFLRNGGLLNTDDTAQPRAISNNWPVFAFATTVTANNAVDQDPITFVLGHVTEPAVSLVGTSIAPLWRSYWADWQSLTKSTFADASDGSLESRSAIVDRKVLADCTKAGGYKYSALCSLALRQALGSGILTNTPTNPYYFVKEISSDGDLQTIDVIYPMMPVLSYFAPELLRYALAPLLAYVESGAWPQAYAPHDLGVFPVGSAHNDGGGENMPIEETANMIIMMAAYTQMVPGAEASTFVSRHYNLVKKWSDYLVANTLDPAYQNTTDDFAGFIEHSSNLALKGILALGAMAKLSHVINQADDAAHYAATAKTYMAQWQSKSTDPTGNYLNLAYGSSNTWSLKYNSFIDKLLGLQLLPDAVLALEQAWYQKNTNTFGPPLDNRHAYTKLDWLLWTSAAIPSVTARQAMIDAAYAYAHTTPSRVPLSDWYDTQTGATVGFIARPVVGGLFSLAARQSAGF